MSAGQSALLEHHYDSVLDAALFDEAFLTRTFTELSDADELGSFPSIDALEVRTQTRKDEASEESETGDDDAQVLLRLLAPSSF